MPHYCSAACEAAGGCVYDEEDGCPMEQPQSDTLLTVTYHRGTERTFTSHIVGVRGWSERQAEAIKRFRQNYVRQNYGVTR